MATKEQKKPARRRRYRVNLIKQTCLYDTNEVAKLFGLHRNTVRHWFREGLKPIDNWSASLHPRLRPQGIPDAMPGGAAPECAPDSSIASDAARRVALGGPSGRRAAHGKNRETDGDLLRLRNPDAPDDPPR